VMSDWKNITHWVEHRLTEAVF